MSRWSIAAAVTTATADPMAGADPAASGAVIGAEAYAHAHPASTLALMGSIAALSGPINERGSAEAASVDGLVLFRAMFGQYPMADTLATYPFVIVRLACTKCSRTGSYRLARLAAKYVDEIDMPRLLEHLAGDCAWWRPRHPYHEGCGACFVDLDPPRRPPDVPGRRLRIVAGGTR